MTLTSKNNIMSKAKNNIPRVAIHVGAPAKSFSAAEGYEPERRGWDENTYRLKNQDTNNHYDFSRNHLNFEINGKGEIVSLGSNPVPLHERLQKRLDELDFKPYKDKDNPLGNSDNSPNCTVGIIVSGDHRVLTRLAFGDQDVDFTLQRSNAHVVLKQGIKDWAMDTYHWACDRWGAENIIGFDVHLDETTPHIQIQTIPVAKTKARGRASVKYVHKDDKSKLLSHKEWKKLPEETRGDFVRTEVERREKECVSYARVWGEDKYAVGKTYYQMHTDYYNEVGHKYGLERGDDIAMLPVEEQRARVHKSKAVLEAERQAEDAIINAKAEKQQLEQQKDKLVGETQNIKSQKARLEDKVLQLEDYAAALDIKEEELLVPILKTNPLVNKAWGAIKEEIMNVIIKFLDSPQPVGQSEENIAISAQDVDKLKNLFANASNYNGYLRLLPQIKQNQIWTIKQQYLDYEGEMQTASHPYMVILISDIEELDSNNSFVRVCPITPFIEMASTSDQVCTDASVVGFPFMIETWNEQPILIEILGSYVGEYYTENIPSDQELTDEIKKFREIEISNARFLNHSILSYINDSEHSGNFSFSVDLKYRDYIKTKHMPVMHVLHPKLMELTGNEEYAVAAKMGNAITENDCIEFNNKQLPFDLEIRKKTDRYVITIIPKVEMSLFNGRNEQIQGYDNSERIVYDNLSKGLYEIKSPLLKEPINIRLK